MAPQAVRIVIRIFPPLQRGAALGLWGVAAGAATLVGPIMGGVVLDFSGWRWIFFVNVPVGIVGIALAALYVPRLPARPHDSDWLGAGLSVVGLSCVVFGIQEGQTYGWGVIGDGPFTIWSVIAVGLIFLAGFVLWQAFNTQEPLLPLRLFRDRQFSLATVAIAAIGFAVTAMALPLMLYTQNVRGLTPTQSALVLVPMAVTAGALSPVVGRLLDRADPQWFAALGFVCFTLGLLWLGTTLSPDAPLWLMEPPIVVLGVASALVWPSVSSMATRTLPSRMAGSGSGVYNALQQVGAVLGSAAIAALMQARLSAELGIDAASGAQGGSVGAETPAAVAAGFSAAMGQSLILPAVVTAIGLLAVVGFAKPVAHPVPVVQDNGVPVPVITAPSSPSPAPPRPAPPAPLPSWSTSSGRRAAMGPAAPETTGSLRGSAFRGETP